MYMHVHEFVLEKSAKEDNLNMTGLSCSSSQQLQLSNFAAVLYLQLHMTSVLKGLLYCEC